MNDFSLLRLHPLRACYLLMAVGISLNFWPYVLNGAAERPMLEGAVNALIGTLGLLAIVGLFSPIRMLPLLVFEVTWKAVWCLSVALPRWLAGTIDAEIASTLFACAIVIPFVFIIPWGYVVRTYGLQSERWSDSA